MNLQDYEELWAWTGEYVLGVLSAEENAEIEHLMTVNEELRGAVQYWQDRLLGMAFMADPVEPEPDLWSRIEGDLDRVGQMAPRTLGGRSIAPVRAVDFVRAVESVEPSRTAASDGGMESNGDRASPALRIAASRRFQPWQNIQFWRFTSVASFAAAVVLAVITLQRPPAPETPAFTAVLQSTGDKKVAWIVQGDRNHTVQITPLAQTTLASHQALELWTIPDPNKDPVSLGLVSRDRSLQIPVHRLSTLKPGQTFAISLEPATGSPTGRPTGKILFAGTAIVPQ